MHGTEIENSRNRELEKIWNSPKGTAGTYITEWLY
jgi:hypothetical protein